jgi:hypothetical protein
VPPLANLYEEIKEMGNQINQTAATSREKEVIQHKVKAMVAKIGNIIEEAKRSEECVQGELENTKGKSIRDNQQFVQYTIPVINNRYELLEKKKEVHEKESHVSENMRTYDKRSIGKKTSRRYGSRVQILGYSHTRGLASLVQHKLGKSFEVLGIVKPAASIEEIVNTVNLNARSYTKKDVCIVWGGTRDVAKNESENGLWQMESLVSRLKHTNFMLINVPHRHDLLEWSCVNTAVKNLIGS